MRLVHRIERWFNRLGVWKAFSPDGPCATSLPVWVAEDPAGIVWYMTRRNMVEADDPDRWEADIDQRK